MKKLLAIILTVCLLACMLCVAAVPASASGDYTVSLCGLGKDGRIWIVGIYDSFEEAWNEAAYYSVNLEEAWNSSERYESEEDRVGEDGFAGIIVELYADWNADSNGSFGSGIGFKNGMIYVPNGAKIQINLGGHTIDSGVANGKVMYIEAGADIEIYNGTVIGDIHADGEAKTSINNVYVAGNTLRLAKVSARFASIFGDGSLSMIVAILALVSSVVSICLTVSYNKKKAILANDAEIEDEE